jgi:hypothetical protein
MPEKISILEKALQGKEDDRVRAIKELQQIGGARAIELIIPHLYVWYNHSAQSAAMEAIDQLVTDPANKLPILEGAVVKGGTTVNTWARREIDGIVVDPQRKVDAYEQALRNNYRLGDTCSWAVQGLRRIGSERAMAILVSFYSSLLMDKDKYVRKEAMEGIDKLTTDPGKKALIYENARKTWLRSDYHEPPADVALWVIREAERVEPARAIEIIDDVPTFDDAVTDAKKVAIDRLLTNDPQKRLSVIEQLPFDKFGHMFKNEIDVLVTQCRLGIQA